MQPDVVIAGAGLIGMACALECERRGMRVTLLDKGRAGQEASWAAAGMLAAHDPENPPALSGLAELSVGLYPDFLDRLQQMSGEHVPFETAWTLEAAAGAVADVAPPGMQPADFRRIHENSLDPRKLAAAALAAVRSSSIHLCEGVVVQQCSATADGANVQLVDGSLLACSHMVDCTGAWSRDGVRPAKGQMLRVTAPDALGCGALGNVVVRAGTLYMVPRLDGSVVIGATVEDAGFDKTVLREDLATLRQHAAHLVPSLAAAPGVESWAGLRPGTADHLPLIGPAVRHGAAQARVLTAAGHFRNGILLAPGTAHVVAQCVSGEQPSVDLERFAPHRFTAPLSL